MGEIWVSKHFQRSEMQCHCPCHGLIVHPLLLQRIEQVRETLKMAINPTCVYRCPTHNKEVGGEDNSAHLYGYAIDIALPILPSGKTDDYYRKKLIECAFHCDICRVGIYSTFVHLDIGNFIDSTVYPADRMWVKLSESKH